MASRRGWITASRSVALRAFVEARAQLYFRGRKALVSRMAKAQFLCNDEQLLGAVVQAMGATAGTVDKEVRRLGYDSVRRVMRLRTKATRPAKIRYAGVAGAAIWC